MISNKIKQFVYWAMVKRFFPKVEKSHLRYITGFQHLPKEGPFIVVANHSSYVDHYLISALFIHVFKKKPYFLTKKESFESYFSKLFMEAEATNCIPVDREKPEIQSFKSMVEVLRKNNILVVYPEGTRGPGDELLPFKPGAFRIALKMKVPIIPIGLVDVFKVMPRGQSYFNNHKAVINIGKPLSVDFIQSQSIQTLISTTKDIIHELALGRHRPHHYLSEQTNSCDAIAGFVNDHIEEVLNDGDYSKIKKVYPQLKKALEYSQINSLNHVPTLVQDGRLLGLYLLATSKASFALNGYKIKRKARRILYLDNNNAFGHYILGSYYLKLPSLMGGDLQKAVYHLSLSYQNAPKYNLDATRFALAYTEALEKNDEKLLAISVLQSIQNYNGDSQRVTNRMTRINDKISSLKQSI